MKIGKRAGTWMLAAVALTGSAGAAASLAGAADSSSAAATTAAAPTTTAPAATTAQPSAVDPAKVAHGPGETLLTGDTAARVTAAAKAAVPGATIIRVETNSSGSTYEAHMQKADGSYVTVEVDSSFKVTATDAGFGGGGHGGAPGADGSGTSSTTTGTSTTGA
jgi:nanoRNase/pAp phosphatase (c-di-AMP/oligoRNAs hydrolase)